MSDLSLIPLQDGFETQLSQDWDGNTGTVYVLSTPSYTPTTTNTYIVVNPGKTNMQIAEITDYDSVAKTLTVSSISFEKGLGISSTAQTHSTGSKVIISDNYQFWEDIQTAINTKLDDTGGTMTGLLQFTGTTHAGIKLLSLTTAQRDALSASNGMIIYNSTTGELNQYIGGAWSVVAAGSTQPTASTTVLGKIKTDVTPAGDPVALITDNPKYDALAGTSGTPSSSNKYVTNDDTSATSANDKVYRLKANGKIDATMLEGNLPALDGSALTNLNAVDPLSLTTSTTATYWTQQIPINVTSTSAATGWTYTGAGGNALSAVNATTVNVQGTTSCVLSSPIYGGGAGNSTYQYNDTKILRIKARLGFQQGGNNIWGFGLVITPANIFTAQTDATSGEIRFVNNNGVLYAQNANGTATSTNVTGSLTLSDFNVYEIVFTPATSILYYINGVLVATHTENIPTDASDALIAFGVNANGRNIYTQFPIISVQL